eukprot:3007705-Rhodomonas_salina.1
MEPKSSEEEPKNKSPRTVQDPKSVHQPRKRPRLNPERRRRQREAAAEGQATPVSASTDAGEGEQALKEQNSTEPGLETGLESEKTQEVVEGGQE